MYVYHSLKAYQEYWNEWKVQSDQINFLGEFRKVSQICPFYHRNTIISSNFFSHLKKSAEIMNQEP